ncbi:MAG TPA: SDR family NAD(P)-dependent oxidoreductase [Solirubrobacterales bacterium]|nr:SDR family NAD(P)-dependent oxidoreductase [Solirubrobacterales bacterium]
MAAATALLGEAIEAVALREPDRVALLDAGSTRTYGQLAMLLDGSRRSGRRRAVAVGPLVADVEALLRRSFGGESLLLLDRSVRPEELERAEALFADPGFADGGEGIQAVGLATSGSGGLPKVVELDWESLLANAGSFAAAAGYGPGDTIWCTTPLAHLFCLGTGVLAGLLSGATVRLGEGMIGPEEFAAAARGSAATVLLSVPFLFRRYLAAFEQDPALSRDWRVRTCIAAGEPVAPDLVEEWRRATGAPLCAHYGLTEGGHVTLAGGAPGEGVGAPLDDVEVEVAAGGAIRLCRRAPQRPYRIAGREADPEGWCETGDLGHLDADGNLHVTGRAGRRIDFAGKKVDPEEVEAALLACEAVADCAVAGVPGEGGERIAAFIELEEGASVSDGEIRAELATRLSPHKLPRHFARVDRVPRTLTGKVRRGELIASLEAVPAAAAAADQLELVRREAAATVLGHASAEAIDPAASFKDLGFDSLAAVELRNRLVAATGLRLPSTVAFDHPTPTLLAEFLRDPAARAGAEPVARLGAAAAAEPLAIVGLGCRYPGGVTSPAELWRLLERGGEAIGPFPGDRGWELEALFDPDPDHPGTSYCERGGFLDDAAEFDAAFFGIGPREARAMDPQQRLLLEVAWETFEAAGVEPEGLAGSRTGVFTGSMRHDYWSGAAGPEDLEPYLGTGNSASVLSGRLAYCFGLEGPALSVDTACSSSLVAMHLAAGALRSGECDLALAGGVSAMSTPWPFVEFSRQRGLARDGRCKPFDAAADGTGFSEGAGLVLLERLSDARANGHQVLALIRGSAVNQDGASNGLTAPNGPSQERVIRQALASAGLKPAEVDAVEAHGTGTALGDPIEAGALLATYGRERDGAPLLLGSVKSNLGHTMAAAGVAGVIKMVQALGNQRLPRTINLEEPTPHVDWSSGEVELLREEREWPRGESPRRAGVSSFGISGTNAHLILEEAPPSPAAPEPAPEPPLSPLLLSARGEGALREMGARLAGHLRDHPDQGLAEVGASLAASRARLPRRAAVIGADRAEAVAALEALAAGSAHPRLLQGTPLRGGLCFLLSGQGAQRPGMGAELYERFPVFAAALDRACAELDPHLDRPLRDLLFAAERTEGAALLDRTQYTQPALFATQAALFALLESLGLRPDFLLGHSIGELTAAHLAGVLGLADAARLVAARGALMGALPGGGGMVAVAASAEEVAAELPAGVSLAAVNAPGAVVLSGPRQAVEEAEGLWRGRGRKTTQLRVSHAFHSELMEPMLEPFAEVARELTYREPQIPIVSNLSGEPLSAEQATDPGYWVAQVREPVRFAAGIGWLAANGAAVFLELGSGALAAPARSGLEGSEARVAPLMRSGRAEAETLAAALAEAHLAGAEPDWGAYFGERPRVDLPTYPFQRSRFWLESWGPGASDPAAIGQADPGHPFLASLIALPGEEGWLATGRISLREHPWLADHVLLGQAVLPGTAFLELGLKAAQIAGAGCLADLAIEAPMAIPEQGALALQLRIGAATEQGTRPLEIHSRPDGDVGGEWTRHASGSLGEQDPPAPEPIGAWPPPGAEEIDLSGFYDRAAELGIEYEPAFQGLRSAWHREAELFAEVDLDPQSTPGIEGFLLHPVLLDAAVHSQIVSLLEGGGLRVPFACRDFCLLGGSATSLRVRLAPATGEPDALSLLLADESGATLAFIGSLATRPISPEQLRLGEGRTGDLYVVRWDAIALPAPPAGAEPREVVRLAADPELDPPAAARALCEQVLATLQGAIASERGTPIAFLSQRAVAVAEGEVPDPALAAAWGLVRSAQAEHPGRFALIDSDGSEASEAVLGVALAIEAEPEVALREGTATVPRLDRAPEPERTAPAPDPAGTVVITGGTGAIGSLLACHMVATHGARRLVLTSRRGAEAPGARELVEELAELGAEAEVRACDVADRTQLEELFASIPAERPPVAVLHCAGDTDDGLVDSLDPQRLQRTMAPKADGAWALHELTKGTPACELVLFSSVAATFQTPGQGNYAAANAFLDALAQRRAAEGLAGLSVGWGGWDIAEGMAGRLAEPDRARISRGGLGMLSAEEGLSALDRARGLGRPLLLSARLDVGALRAAAAAGGQPPLLASLVGRARRQPPAGSLADRIGGASRAEGLELMAELVRSDAAIVLGHASPEAIDPAASFKDLGFDSLAAVELRNRLAAATGLRLASTVAFDHPSVEALASFLQAEVEGNRREAKVRSRPRAEEPLAIVGLGCRYPGGAGSPAELWRLLEQGGEAIGPFPGDRGWELEALFDPDPDHPGTSYCERGGFLERAAEFDADFFGIGPREARAMDPQQRLLLEVAWETLEEAGIDPGELAGSETGAFVGVMHNDYVLAGSEPLDAEGYQGVGTAGSVLSGRLAYCFGFEGPAVTVDTACSSSLVAMHLAAGALRGGECDLALAGGVSIRSTPVQFVEFSRQRGLARDGRCKPFDAAADGTGFSEGAGLVLLERLSDAQRNGHQVLALLRGSAVNQDGASNGLTAPNGPSQERVIRQALASAGLEPAEVDAVEAHGTGTALGDPIEAGALLATYGRERDGAPLLLGSVKSNLGHTMAAAGVAGVIKMVQALGNQRLPRTINLEEPTPHVDWSSGEVELLREEREWPRGESPRRAGVSSFGISGTNAHLILEEAPPAPPAPEPAPGPPLSPLLLSARGEGALREMGARLAGHLRSHPDQGLAEVGATLAATRARLPRRAAVIGADRAEAIAALEALGRGAPHAALVEGRDLGGRLCFLFPGQGSQWRGMAADLLGRSPVFAEQVDACEQALAPHVGFSVREVLEGGAYSEAVEVIQPALFAVMVSLAGLWRASGVEPDAVLGHSQGEIAAACVAGALSLEDAAKVVALRSRLLASELAGRGGMASVHLPATEVAELIAPWGEAIGIAALNSPASTVVSGTPDALAELLARCGEDGIRARGIAVDYASHSPQVEATRERLLAELASISPRPAQVPVYSAMSGEPIAGEEMGAGYWYSSMREPVRFYPAISRLLADGFSTFVESSAHPVLVPAVAECAAEEGREVAAIATLRREEDGEERFAKALAEAHLAGAEPDWGTYFGERPRVSLPTYPFQRTRYWLEGRGPGASDPAAIGQADPEHPFLASLIALPGEEGWLATGRVSLRAHPWLAEHMVLGTAILPGTGFIELALKAARIAAAGSVSELAIEAPMVIPEQGALALQLRIGPQDDQGERSLEIHSRREDSEEEAGWTRHATGTLGPETSAPAPQSFAQWPPEGAQQLDLSGFYGHAAELGIDYGPAFQGLKAAWRRGSELFAEVELDPEQAAEAERFGIHPALLDAAVHLDLVNQEPAAAPRTPFACSDISLGAEGHSALRSRIAPTGNDVVRLAVAAPDGTPVATIDSLAIRRIDPAALHRTAADAAASLYQVAWSELDLPGAAGAEAEPRLLRLAPDPELDPPAAARDLCQRALDVLRQAISSGAGEAEESPEPIAFLTEGAVAVTEGEAPDPALASLWGLVRSAQAEHPGRFLLVDSDASEASEAALAAALAIEAEPEIALRGGIATAPRLAPLGRETIAPAAPLDPEGTVVITGGTGTVGAHLARHLAATHGARHLVLISRRGADAPGAKELLAELEELGAQAEVRACDVSDPEALAELFASIPTGRPPAAVLHAAAVFDNGLVESIGADRLGRAMAPKADAAWHLHELTREIEGCELILFSSIAGTLQSPGQGNYAAANAFLDALAQRREAEGLAGVSVGWGLWAAERVDDEGLAATDLARLRRIGIVGMQTDRALGLFDLSRSAPAPSFLATPVNRAALRPLARAGAVPALLRGLAPAPPADHRRAETLAERLPKLAEAERAPAALALVRAHAAEVLGHSSPERIDPEAPFQEMGFDSLAAVDLRTRLARSAGLRLPATLVFDQPTPAAVAAYLVAEIGGAPPLGGTDRKLDEIASILVSIEAEERARAAARLRPLFADLLAAGDEEEDAVDFEAASDEELLQLIDRELGPC